MASFITLFVLQFFYTKILVPENTMYTTLTLLKIIDFAFALDVFKKPDNFHGQSITNLLSDSTIFRSKKILH